VTDHDDATVAALEMSERGSLLGPPAGPERDAQQHWAEQLVEQAQADGVQLVGPGGLLAEITRRVLELGLELCSSARYPVRHAGVQTRRTARSGTRPAGTRSCGRRGVFSPLR
jgi:hypothetical protein